MDLDEFAKEVHALAVEKGFCDPEPNDAELIAAIHSEISEAFEEWRARRSMVYHECVLDLMCDGNGCSDGFDPKDECKYRNPEPHGIAVELIDVALRILDAAAAWDYEIKPLEKPEPIIGIRGDNREIEALVLPEIVLYLHQTAAVVYIARINRESAACSDYMSDALAMVFTWLHAQGIDPEAVMLEKHEYNKTRPYRHGGKRV